MPIKTIGQSRKSPPKQARRVAIKNNFKKVNHPIPLKEPLEGKALDAFQKQTLVAIGKSIRAARYDRDMTMKMVFEAAGLERAYYGRLELGQVNVSVVNLRKIAHAMDTTILLMLADSGI